MIDPTTTPRGTPREQSAALPALAAVLLGDPIFADNRGHPQPHERSSSSD